MKSHGLAGAAYGAGVGGLGVYGALALGVPVSTPVAWLVVFACASLGALIGKAVIIGCSVLVPLYREKDYSELRNQIEDCDVFLFRGDFKTSQLFEQWAFTYYSHVAFVLWCDDRLMVFQAEGRGIEAAPLSRVVDEYRGRVDWYRLKPNLSLLPDDFDLDAAKETVAAEGRARLGVRFGYLALLKNLVYWAINLELADPSLPKGMFCAQYVEHCFRHGGIPLAQVEDDEGDEKKRHWFKFTKPTADMATFPKHIKASPHIEYRATFKMGTQEPGE